MALKKGLSVSRIVRESSLPFEPVTSVGQKRSERLPMVFYLLLRDVRIPSFQDCEDHVESSLLFSSYLSSHLVDPHSFHGIKTERRQRKYILFIVSTSFLLVLMSEGVFDSITTYLGSEKRFIL